jgi:MFS family permease
MMAIGYPVGAVLGGMVAQQLLEVYTWRSVFYLGAGVTAFMIPVVYFVVPESVHWLVRKQPSGAIDQVNRAMSRMGHAPIAALPSLTAPTDAHRATGSIFSSGLLATTVIVTFAYFFHITTFYFILKWVPKIVADFGFAASSAAGVLVWANVGGATGGAIFGLLTQRFGVKALTIGVLLLSTVGVTLFGQTPPDLQRLSMICAVAGFFGNAAIVGLYAILAQAFPTHVRAFGTGFTVGVGRGGSVLAPVLAGFLFEGGYTLPIVAFIMALGSLLSAGVLLLLKLEPDEGAKERVRQERDVRPPSAVPAPRPL